MRVKEAQSRPHGGRQGEADRPPELLDRIYASALEPDAWPGALEAIAAAFDTEAGLVYSTYVFTTNVR